MFPLGWREMLTSAAGRETPAHDLEEVLGPVFSRPQVGHPDLCGRPRCFTTTRPTASGALVRPETTMAYCGYSPIHPARRLGLITRADRVGHL